METLHMQKPNGYLYYKNDSMEIKQVGAYHLGVKVSGKDNFCCLVDGTGKKYHEEELCGQNDYNQFLVSIDVPDIPGAELIVITRTAEFVFVLQWPNQ